MNIFIKFDYYFYEEKMSEVHADIIIYHLWCDKFFEERIFINIINQIMKIYHWKASNLCNNKYYRA